MFVIWNIESRFRNSSCIFWKTCNACASEVGDVGDIDRDVVERWAGTLSWDTGLVLRFFRTSNDRPCFRLHENKIEKFISQYENAGTQALILVNIQPHRHLFF